MAVCAPTRSAPLTVPDRFTPIDPETVHVCTVCDRVDYEESPTFDMSHCAWAGGWIDRDCHNVLLSQGGCHDPLCDPHHI
jgi:hypothetical protein